MGYNYIHLSIGDKQNFCLAIENWNDILNKPTAWGVHLSPKKDEIFIIGKWNAKVASQEILGVTGKFGLGVQNEAGQRVTEFCEENLTDHSTNPLPIIREKTLHMDFTRLPLLKSD